MARCFDQLLEQLRLTQTIEEQERERNADLGLAEEGREDREELRFKKPSRLGAFA